MRKCPFHGCEKRIPDERFACGPHWFSLNSEEKAEIHATYQAYLNEFIGVEELRERQQAVLGERGSAVDPSLAEVLRKMNERNEDPVSVPQPPK
jgi:hypothetical protein